MSDIHIRVQDVERIRTTLKVSERAIRDAVRTVENSRRAADWNDPNSKEFDVRLDALKRRSDELAKAFTELEQYTARVVSKAKDMGAR